MTEIIPFESRYAGDFKRLNLEWLDGYDLTEDHDLKMLNDPEGIILKPGGAIFLARIIGEIVGTAALLREHDGVYELAKMAVTKSHQGLGISKLLLVRCLHEANLIGAKKLILFSNHRLEAALKLYKQFGFIDIPVERSPFVTADVKMELVL